MHTYQVIDIVVCLQYLLVNHLTYCPMHQRQGVLLHFKFRMSTWATEQSLLACMAGPFAICNRYWRVPHVVARIKTST
jgi:hypothetical protein